jgi:hypothetical protein
MRNRESGMIAVETIIAFIGFLMVTVIIILFVNLAAVQTRVHHALTQTAKEVSVYSYLFDVVGVTGLRSSSYELSSKTRGELNGALNNSADILDSITGISGGFKSRNLDQMKSNFELGKSGAAGGYEQLKAWAKDPKDFFSGLLMVLLDKGLDTGFDALFGYWIAPAIFDRYMEISGGASDAQSYLRSMGVLMDGYNPSDETRGLTFIKWEWALRDGVDNSGFQGSRFLTGGNEIIIKVEYYYDLGAFIRILGPKYSKLKVVQQVAVKAWVGDGKRYNSY